MKVDNYTLADGTPWRLFTPDDAYDGWAVLWLQGFTSTIEGHHEGCERMSAASNVPFAILNYAGHGNHLVPLEQATRKQQFEEVCAVYDELVNRGFDKIIVIGGSFGGYMAALLAGSRKPQTVILRAAANYKDEEFDYPYAETTESKEGETKDLYRQSIDTTHTNMATEALKSFNGTSYIIEHEADTLLRQIYLSRIIMLRSMATTQQYEDLSTRQNSCQMPPSGLILLNIGYRRLFTLRCMTREASHESISFWRQRNTRLLGY